VKKVRKKKSAYLAHHRLQKNTNNLVEDEVINIIIFVVNFLLKPECYYNVYASYYELQYII